MLQWIKQHKMSFQKTATVLGVLFVAVFSFLKLAPALAQTNVVPTAPSSQTVL
jgi:predicted XRE-type DNA-binding protein